MFRSIKKYLYFPVAVYFRFFATIKLKKWHPRIIVITGSSGKTTLLHLIESQLGGMAKYSHDANSSIGIPFDILGLHRKSLTLDEWPLLFLLAPFKAFSPSPKEKLYVVEADCDRPNEGDFLSLFLRPEVTLWINVGRTHVMNFEDTVKRGRFSSVEESVAFEFGYFAERTRSLVIVNEDSELVQKQLKRVKCKVDKVSSKKNLTKYEITLVGTMFELKNEKFTFPYLLPKETSVSVLQCLSLLSYLGVR
jgi:UDP-N-acetylmuramyl pentapeptide synthase